MVVTRSQRSKSGSPTSPTTANAAPSSGKKGQKSKAKAEKTTAAPAGQKPAKVRKKKSPKRKGPKPAPSPGTPLRATFNTLPKASPRIASKVASKRAPRNIKVLQSRSLFAAGELTPETLEDLGLAYVDVPSLRALGSEITPSFGPMKPPQTPRSAKRKTDSPHTEGNIPTNTPPKNGMWRNHPEVFPIEWRTNSTHQRVDPLSTVPLSAPATFQRGGRSFWSDKYPVSPILPGAVARGTNIEESPRRHVFGAIAEPSPRGIRAGEALLKAVDSASSSPVDWDKILASIEEQLQPKSGIRSPSGRKRATTSPTKRASTTIHDIIRQVVEQPASPPSRPTRPPGYQAGEGIREGNDEVEEERPETPVSVNNAEVFKRPTVADLRRERWQMHDELDEWARSLKFARAELDGVIGGMEARMRVIKAVNRMQAPLRKAPLRRGR